MTDTTATKTIEVRVKYPHLADLAAGDVICFHSRAPTKPARSRSSGSPNHLSGREGNPRPPRHRDHAYLSMMVVLLP